jgi:hypothetical protein
MFKDCTSLESINIPGTITSIATNAFENCVNLVEVTLQSGVTSIGNNAFKGCLKMTTLELPDTITSLGTGIFDGAPLFEGFKLAGNNLSYKEKDGVIYNYEMNRLVNFPIAYTGSYEIPETITEILAGTFAGSMLSEVVIPASITTIPKDAFKGCTQLTHVILHDGVSTISDGAFYGCTSLTKISSKEGSQVVEQLPSGLRTIGKESFYKTALKNVHIGAFVTTIGDYAFAYCLYMKDEHMGIDGRNYGLTDLIINGDLEYLGSNLLNYSYFVLNITFNGDLSNLEYSEDVFNGHNPTEHLFVNPTITFENQTSNVEFYNFVLTKYSE